MVETVVALLLFLNGNMVEHVYKDNLAQCNESKKIAESVVNTRNVTFVCKEVKAKTIVNDISEENGKVINATKEGIPFPDLNMSGFLKQTMGIQKLFQAQDIILEN